MAGIAKDHPRRGHGSCSLGHPWTTRLSQTVFRLLCRTNFPSGRLSSLDLWTALRGRSWFATSPTTLHSCLQQTSGMHRSKACLKPLQLPISLGQTRFSKYHSSDIVKRRSEKPTRASARKDARAPSQLADDAGLDQKPELYAEFETDGPASNNILEIAEKLEADHHCDGLHDSAFTGVISHLDLANTYDVVCRAGSPRTHSFTVPQCVLLARKRPK